MLAIKESIIRKTLHKQICDLKTQMQAYIRVFFKH